MYDKDLLASSYKLRELMEAEQSEAFDRVEALLMMVLDVYIRDQDCESGRIPNPFTSVHQRILFLYFILNNVNTIIDRIREHAEELECVDDLPLAASGLIKFLFAISLNVINTIRTLEAGRGDRNTPATQAKAQGQPSRIDTEKHR